MNNLSESQTRLKDAAGFMQSAQTALDQRDFKVATHYAQLTIELSAKAVIAHFEEPRWVHNPAKQLAALVERERADLTERFGEGTVADLLELIDSAEYAAPWHGWSTYGKRDQGTWIAAADLATQDIANDLVKRARRALETAQHFLTLLNPPSEPPKQTGRDQVSQRNLVSPFVAELMCDAPFDRLRAGFTKCVARSGLASHVLLQMLVEEIRNRLRQFRARRTDRAADRRKTVPRVLHVAVVCAKVGVASAAGLCEREHATLPSANATIRKNVERCMVFSLCYFLAQSYSSGCPGWRS